MLTVKNHHRSIIIFKKSPFSLSPVLSLTETTFQLVTFPELTLSPFKHKGYARTFYLG